MSARSAWWSVATPLAFAAAAAATTRFVTDQPEMVAQMTRGIAGPTTWPTLMLWGMFVFAFGWAVERAARVLRHREGQVAAKVQSPAGWRVWAGIVLVLAYGFSLPTLGFAVATPLYLLLWLLLGGERSSRLLAGVTVIGSVALLYMFVKLALMPLDRGVGVIGEFTVQLYRWLGIY